MKTKRISLLKPGEVAVLGIATVGLIAVFMISSPVQNMSAERHVQATVMEIPTINELRILNWGLTSITLKWSQPADSIKVATYKVYMDNDLIGTVDGNVHTYTATGLRTGGWYQFHVDACDVSGKCSNNGPVVGARTTTIQQATEAIIDKIENLVSNGVLTANQGDSLIRSLAAIYQLDKDNDAHMVINHLQAFTNDTNSLTAAGVLSPEIGHSLVVATNDIIRNIKG